MARARVPHLQPVVDASRHLARPPPRAPGVVAVRLTYARAAHDAYFAPRDLEGEYPPHLVAARPCAGCGQSPYEPASCSCCGSRETDAPVCVCCAHAGRGGAAARAAAAACRCAGCEEELAAAAAAAAGAGQDPAGAAAAPGAAATAQEVAAA
ncbi:hypothetical protein HXX76_010741 [Chlamydomonas incerta]|uniref:Uncharacterized protein n=1 Tax=Chlamydomonas incerta TaxID=51695 RepID=A0A835VYA3_CHLIN|nr:hypothetical protein HXX76_010741 [Chlamydomonas incerta]|eukprot:KAG2429506.1 hypothetical protein HXX76_010741 [Chlamydomonas incerta]